MDKTPILSKQLHEAMNRVYQNLTRLFTTSENQMEKDLLREILQMTKANQDLLTQAVLDDHLLDFFKSELKDKEANEKDLLTQIQTLRAELTEAQTEIAQKSLGYMNLTRDYSVASCTPPSLKLSNAQIPLPKTHPPTAISKSLDGGCVTFLWDHGHHDTSAKSKLNLLSQQLHTKMPQYSAIPDVNGGFIVELEFMNKRYRVMNAPRKQDGEAFVAEKWLEDPPAPATKFMGSFNPWGNQQTTCTCIYPSLNTECPIYPVHIKTAVLQMYCRKARALQKKIAEDPALFEQLRTGSFNPYGNGQSKSYFVDLEHETGPLPQHPFNFLSFYTDDKQDKSRPAIYTSAMTSAYRQHQATEKRWKGKNVEDIKRWQHEHYDTFAAVRHTKEFKEGSFNPYGNGQTTKEDHYSKRQRIRKQKQYEKTRRAYDRLIHQNENNHCAKHLHVEVIKFQTLLSERGYSSPTASQVPKTLINQALEQWVEGHGLIHCGTLLRMNRKHREWTRQAEGEAQNLPFLQPPNKEPQKGREMRKLILQTTMRWQKTRVAGTSEMRTIMSFVTPYLKDAVMVELKKNLIVPSPVTAVTDFVKHGYELVQTAVTSELAKLGIEINPALYYLVVVAIFIGFFGWNQGVLISLGIISTATMVGKVGKSEMYNVKPPEEDPNDVNPPEEFSRTTGLSIISEFLKRLGEWMYGAWKSFSSINWREAMKSLSQFSVDFRNIKEFFKSISELWNDFVDWISEMWTGLPWRKEARLMKMIQSVDADLMRMMSNGNPAATSDRDYATKFSEKFEELRSLTFQLMPKATKDQINQLKMATFKYLEHYRACLVSLKGDKLRPRPVWLDIVGETNQGKSNFVNLFCHALYDRLNLGEWHNSLIEVRNQNEEFWSNYNGKFALLIDDYLQEKDEFTRCMQAMEIIHIVNEVPMSLMMPDVERKGTTFFQSKILVTTANTDGFPTDLGIECEPAFWRRRDFLIKLQLKPGVVRTSNVGAEAIDNYIILEADDVTSKTTSWKRITFMQLLSKAIIHYYKYQGSYQFKEDKKNFNWDQIISAIPKAPLDLSAEAQEKYFESLAQYAAQATDLQVSGEPPKIMNVDKQVPMALMDVEMRKHFLAGKYDALMASVPKTELIQTREHNKMLAIMSANKKLPKSGIKRWWFEGENKYHGDLVMKEFRVIVPQFKASINCMPELWTGKPQYVLKTVLSCPLCHNMLFHVKTHLDHEPAHVTAPNVYGLVCCKCDYNRSLYSVPTHWLEKNVLKVLKKPEAITVIKDPHGHGTEFDPEKWRRYQNIMENLASCFNDIESVESFDKNNSVQGFKEWLQTIETVRNVAEKSQNRKFVKEIISECNYYAACIKCYDFMRQMDEPNGFPSEPGDPGHDEAVYKVAQMRRNARIIRFLEYKRKGIEALTKAYSIPNRVTTRAIQSLDLAASESPKGLNIDDIILERRKKQKTGQSQGIDYYLPAVRDNQINVPASMENVKLPERIESCLTLAGRACFTWGDLVVAWPGLIKESLTWCYILDEQYFYHPWLKHLIKVHNFRLSSQQEGYTAYGANSDNIFSMDARLEHLRVRKENAFCIYTREQFRKTFKGHIEIMSRMCDTLTDKQNFLAYYCDIKGNLGIYDIGIIISIAVGAFVILSLIVSCVIGVISFVQSRGLKGNKFVNGVSESESKYSKKQQGLRQKKIRRAVKGTSGVADQNCEDIAVNFYRNTYGIQCLMSDGRMTSSNLLMISGQIGFMTRHAAFLWRKKGIVPVELIVDFASKGSSFGKVHSRAFKFVDFENNYGDGFRDIIGVVIPEAPLSLDLKHHLRESPLEHKIQQPMRVERRRDGTLNTTTGIAIYRDDDAIVCPPALPDAEGVTLEDVLIAEGMDHENGHCGYAVLCKNPAMEKKFMGIHVGGTNEGSLIEEITLSMFNQCVQKLGKSECFAEIGFGNPFKYSISKTYFKEEPLEDKYIGYRSIGTIDPPVMTPNKTSLEATIVNKGCIFEGKRLDPPYEIREAPALLGLKRLPDGKIIDPYTLSLRKLASKLFLPQIELLFDPAVWKGIFKEKLKHYDFTPLTVKEAFCGTRDARNIPGIDRSTSATFPLSSWGWSREDLYRPEIKDAQGNIIQEFWVHEELLAHINYIIAEMEAGRIDPHFVISCLKDERRTLDRVEAGYTRMFKIGQLARLIITRMYILPFMIAVEHSQCTDIMVGCNPTSSDWKRIYDMMCKFSGAKYIVAQDVSGWDLHYYQPIIRAFCIHYADFFGLKYELMKHLYMILIANICVYVVLRGLIALSSEMPSGVFITSFFNSVLNSVKHRICFLVQCLRKLGHALDFDEYNFLRVFGDDSIMAILEAIINMWNGIIFAKLAKEIFNHDHTSSSKGDLKPYEPLNEVFFLQRQFLPHEGLVLAPLNRITLEGMVQYIMKSKNETHAEIFKTVCHNALDEWALYGPNEFDKHKGILNAFLRYYKKDYSYNYKWEDVIAVWARRVETKA